MTTGDPPQQKTSQGNEKKKDENITQGQCDFSKIN